MLWALEVDFLGIDVVYFGGMDLDGKVVRIALELNLELVDNLRTVGEAVIIVVLCLLKADLEYAVGVDPSAELVRDFVGLELERADLYKVGDRLVVEVGLE